MGGAGDADRRQLSRPVNLRQNQRVAAVGLDAISCLHRDQRRGHHHAIMPTAGQQSVQPITTTAGIVAEAQATPQPRRQLHQKLGTALENPQLAKLAAAATLGKRATDRGPRLRKGRLVHIQSDIVIVSIRSVSPCIRLGAGHPPQPSTFCISRDGPPRSLCEHRVHSTSCRLYSALETS
jgi:hypothetical protein